MNRKIILVLTVGVLTISCSGEQNTDGLVAMVDNYTLSIDDAVDLLVDEERLAADAGVVKAVAELWLNYTLLAEATATDSTFSMLDFEPLVMRQAQQVMVFQLRDSVIQVDTFMTEEELRQLYETEEPALEMRAIHNVPTAHRSYASPKRQRRSSAIRCPRSSP